MRTSALYRFLRFCAQLTMKFFFRKIHWIGAEQIPKKGPLLIASNHPMAFTEACLLAAFLNRPIHFMVRGDAFVKKWLWFFRATNQIPIYRFRDGFENLRKNKTSLIDMNQVLLQGGAILIFVEGESIYRKQLGSMQKGLARMAMEFYNSGGSEIHVLPVGINYDDGLLWRSDVFVSFGKPYPLIMESDITDRANIKRWTDELQLKMEERVWHIQSNRLASSAGVFRKHYYKDTFPLWPSKVKHNQIFEKRWKLVAEINSGHTKPIFVSKYSILTIFLSILLFPVIFIGFLISGLPLYFAYYFARKNELGIEFITAIKLGVLMVSFIIIMVLVAIIGAVIYWPFLFTPLILILAIKVSLNIYDRWNLLMAKT